MKALPGDVVVYRRTPEYDHTAVPAGLRRRHTTKAGEVEPLGAVRFFVEFLRRPEEDP